jgi:transposase
LVIGLQDQDGKRIAHRRLECDLKKVIEFLKPFRKEMEAIAVESTFNWYWLVDGLKAAAYPVVLANPAKIDQYHGIKHADDTSDAFFLAELLRLKILPTGYVYDPELRPVRDLLRRRMSLVHQRTSLMLSFKTLFARTTGQRLLLSKVKAMSIKEAEQLYEHPANQLIAGLQKKHIEDLDESIAKIEKGVLKVAARLPYYPKLQTLPGVGRVLGLTITMEVGDVQRFPSPEDFASYCRTVDSKHLSNGKRKADNNQKCGNKYLAWAFVEGAQFAKRYDELCRRWYDRKAAKTSTVIATKALACKLSKAAWYLMAQNADYDPKRVFPELALKMKKKEPA